MNLDPSQYGQLVAYNQPINNVLQSKVGRTAAAVAGVGAAAYSTLYPYYAYGVAQYNKYKGYWNQANAYFRKPTVRRGYKPYTYNVPIYRYRNRVSGSSSSTANSRLQLEAVTRKRTQ